MQGFPVSGLREINLLLNLHHENIVPLTEIVVGKHLDRFLPFSVLLCFIVCSVVLILLILTACRVAGSVAQLKAVGLASSTGRSWASCSHLCASVTKQYNLVLVKGR